VEFRAVAFVLAEAILRETRAEVAHNRVAGDFRDHARGRDREAVAIAVDDRGLRQRKGKHRETIDEHVLRLNGKAGDGRAHGFVGRAQDVYRIDLDRIDNANGPGDRVIRDEIVVNFFAFLRKELFRIVQLPMPKSLRKDNGRRYNRPRQRAAPGFVDAGDGGDTERAKPAFMPETTAAVHEGKILKR